MAGTDDDDPTLDWLLLGATRNRVTEYTDGSQKQAEDILLDGLDQYGPHQRPIRWRYRELRISDPHWVWTPETAKRFFFDRLGAGKVDVDWINHNATRTGPAFVPMGEKGAQILANGPRTILEARLIFLCWNDVLDILQPLGLTPQSSDLTAASSTPAPASTQSQQSPPESSTAEEPAPEAPSTPHKRNRRAPQVELVGELIAIVFPENKWHDMTPAAVLHKCDLDPRVKAKLQKEEKSLPSLKSFVRFMKRASARAR